MEIDGGNGNYQNNQQRKDIAAGRGSHIEAGLTSKDDMELAQQFKEAGEKMQNRGIYQEKPQGTWDRFKSFFKKDAPDKPGEQRPLTSSEILNVYDDQARNASIERQVRRENIGASEDQIQDILAMRTLKPRNVDTRVSRLNDIRPLGNVPEIGLTPNETLPVESVPTRSDVIDVVSQRSKRLDEEKKKDNVINMQYDSGNGDRISFYYKDGELKKSVMHSDDGGKSWQFKGESDATREDKVAALDFVRSKASKAA